MPIQVRAIYEKGILRLLTPVDLVEGQEVEITLTLPKVDKTEELPEDVLRKALTNYTQSRNPAIEKRDE